MFAYNYADNRSVGCVLYIGHFNDGVVE
jgi:hypothetical protein